MTEILIRQLRTEHQDREWVDRNGYHWAWCEDQWMYWVMEPWSEGDLPGYETWSWKPPKRQPTEFDYGPFMEALHHRAIWGKQWNK